MEDYCFGCAKKRKVKKVGEYIYEGKTHPIVFCQWCAAARSRRRNKSDAERGKKALKDASDKADKAVEKLRDEMKINPDDLNKPMTI